MRHSSEPSLAHPRATLGRGVKVRLGLGGRWVSAAEAANLEPGCVLELDSLAEDSVDVLANGRLIARGCGVDVGGKLGVRISRVLRDEE